MGLFDGWMCRCRCRDVETVERKEGVGLRTGRGCGGGEGGGHGEEGVEEMGYWVGMHGGGVVDGWMWGVVYVCGGCGGLCVWVFVCMGVCTVDDSTNKPSPDQALWRTGCFI